MRIRSLLFVLVCAPLTASCLIKTATHNCTDIGCDNGLRIELAKATWEAGSYEVKIEADGKTITCTTKLPLSASDPTPSSCTDANVLLGVSGSALPAAQQSLSDLIFLTAPAQVTVTVTRDGAMIGEKAFTPTYKKSQPNGPDCEPTCNNASETLPLS